MVTWGSIMVYTPLESSDRVNAGSCHLFIVYLRSMKHLCSKEVPPYSDSYNACPFLSWTKPRFGKMATWGSIMVHTPLESSDRVNDGPCHLSIWYLWKGVWNTFVLLRCHHIPTAVILNHFSWNQPRQEHGDLGCHNDPHPSRKSDGLNAGPCHLSIGYGKECKISLQQWGANITLQL